MKNLFQKIHNHFIRNDADFRGIFVKYNERPFFTDTKYKKQETNEDLLIKMRQNLLQNRTTFNACVMMFVS